MYELARLSSDMHMYSFGLVESQATTGGGEDVDGMWLNLLLIIIVMN